MGERGPAPFGGRSVGSVGESVTRRVSSASNFVLGVVVARSLGPEGFGAFSLTYLTYAFVLNAMRGRRHRPARRPFQRGPHRGLAPRRRRLDSDRRRRSGVLAGVVCVLVGLVLPDTLSGGFIALGVGPARV